MTRNGWTAERVRDFERLPGRRVKAWTGIEMALREGPASDGPHFEDPAVPCLQLNVLGALFDDGTFMTIGTYEGDAVCGLWLRRMDDGRPDWSGQVGIYRSRALPELPTGEIDRVSTVLDQEVVAEVVLRIGGRQLLLMAGELHEGMQGRLVFTRFDESVLAFADPSAAESVDWVPGRGRRRLG
ncbi:hypothetical protein ACQP2X_33840 [Actinoplanes sp. CA-131856]